MTRKNVMKAMAEVKKENKKNVTIAAGAAGLTGVITSAAVFLINNHKNKKSEKEIENLRNDIATIDTKVTVTENIIAATTKAAAANDDVKDNVKYVPINIYEYTGAINNKKPIFTKSGSGDSLTFSPVTDLSLESYSFATKYYMTESDYNEIFKAEEKTAETTEENKDKK